MFKPTQSKRILFFLIFDIIISFVTLLFSYNLRFNFSVPEEFMQSFFVVFWIIVILKILLLWYFKLYNISWRFFSLNEAKKIFNAHLIAYSIFSILFFIEGDIFAPFARSIIIIDFFLSFVFISGLRIAKRLILEGHQNKALKPTVIVGATEFTQTLLKNSNDFYVVAILEDNKMSIGSYFFNRKVLDLKDLEKIVVSQKIESIIIAKKIEPNDLNDLSSRCNKLGINDIKIIGLSDNKSSLRKLSVEDLLARYPKDLDKRQIEKFIKNKKVLITGAGGSIGSEISRKCANLGASELILLDHSEFNLYSIAEELCDFKPHLVMQSVVNKELLDKTFAKYKPDIVIHAAAYKHVPLVEENIEEAILNNIIGTKNSIDCAIKHGVQKFVLISTDKAVRPTNVMGTTKRVCELYAQNVISSENIASNTTEIVAVRFGNVLGSSGSVIPKFKAQIEAGKNVTVTHPDITRYFMLIPEACELVLQAASIGRGGEIFILDMGEPVKIVDLAKKMIELSGRDDIQIEFSGLRAGEKLYEELLISDSDTKTEYESIMVAGKTNYNITKLNKDIDELLSSSNKIEKLKEIVPEFEHKKC
jgi:UDP-N-acetyl-D-glucosamine 4,6-dehydratase